MANFWKALIGSMVGTELVDVVDWSLDALFPCWDKFNSLMLC
jgi:hypothetical protein